MDNYKKEIESLIEKLQENKNSIPYCISTIPSNCFGKLWYVGVEIKNGDKIIEYEFKDENVSWHIYELLCKKMELV